MKSTCFVGDNRCNGREKAGNVFGGEWAVMSLLGNFANNLGKNVTQ